MFSHFRLVSESQGEFIQHVHQRILRTSGQMGNQGATTLVRHMRYYRELLDDCQIVFNGKLD